MVVVGKDNVLRVDQRLLVPEVPQFLPSSGTGTGSSVSLIDDD